MKISPDERAAVLATQQSLKMARSAHAFVRGSTVSFYRWLENSHIPDIPDRPRDLDLRRRALGRRWNHLARERIEDVSPAIPLGRKFWALTDEERQAVEALFKEPEIKGLVLTLNARADTSKIEVVDAAYWMKGCSSLGKLRYAVLVEVNDGRQKNYALIDIKEAVEAAAPPHPGADMPAHHGARVVAGARAYRRTSATACLPPI